MEILTKFLRLRAAPALGDSIEGWRVCWLGGWDRGRVFFVVMVERKSSQPARARRTRKGGNRPDHPHTKHRDLTHFRFSLPCLNN